MGEELLVSSPIPYTDQFNAVFPYYLAMGMTYDQFWNDNPWLAKDYREADKIKRQRENQALWLQGMYVYEAICSASPLLHAFAKKGTKAHPYIEEPYPLNKKELEDREEATARRKYEKHKAIFHVQAANINSELNAKEVAKNDDR